MLLTRQTIPAVFDGTALNNNYTAIENSLADLGPYVISGLVPSAGTGLSVSVTSGTASIGGRVTVAASFTIGGLVDATTNHLYLLDTGTGTSNTTGTQPANSVKLGTATTAGGVVTSVNVARSGGRQLLVRPENQVPGNVGSPGTLNLNSWNASAGDGFQFTGILPAGAIPAGGAASVVTKSANYTLTTSDSVVLGDATGGSFTLTLPAVASHSGLTYRIKKIDSTVNTVTIDANASEQIDGALTAVLSTQWAAVDLVCNGTAWFLF